MSFPGNRQSNNTVASKSLENLSKRNNNKSRLETPAPRLLRQEARYVNIHILASFPFGKLLNYNQEMNGDLSWVTRCLAGSVRADPETEILTSAVPEMASVHDSGAVLLESRPKTHPSFPDP